MGNKALKGLTIRFGANTSDLKKALENIEKQGSSLSSELGQINRLLKLDPKNTELLAQKQKVLCDAISNTEKKLDTLKDAEKQVQAQFERGEVSEAQYRALQREIIATEKKLDGYKNAARETAGAVEQLGKASAKAGNNIEEQGKKTEEAEKATEDMNDAAGGLAAGGLAALATAAAAAVTAIVALAEESREYRTEMGKLDAAFTTNGHSAEVATKTYEALQSILGETDQAVEAANHLAKLCTSEEELAAWTNIATGVYAQFGKSLPIEGLTEAANETMRAGQVVGPFADALNWAAAEGENFGIVMKEATEENEKWNQAVSEAKTAEDYFNLALQECSGEQERQQLITETLTSLYGAAAEQYKKTNEEVIRANEATEKWNKTTAIVGKTVEPVITDIKELGATLLEDAEKPLERAAKFTRKEVLPAIERVSTWSKQNIPLIKSGLVGVSAAMVAFKVATIAATVSQKGLRGAIIATTVAQKALALAQATTPWGWVAIAITGVVAAMVALNEITRETAKPIEVLTEEEQELVKAAQETAEAFREQQAATDEAMGNIMAEMGHVEKLAEELRGLADASGKVQEKDQARANFIIGELNEALGTEYEMVDGVILKYEELKTSIDQVIASKRAQALVDAYNAQYVAAIQQEAEAFQGMILAQEDYLAAKDRATEKLNAANAAKAEYNRILKEEGAYAAEEAKRRHEEAYAAFEAEREIVLTKKSTYDQAVINYKSYYDTIANFEEAQAAAIEGNFTRVEDILVKKGSVFGTYSEKVDTETAKVLDTLYKEAIDAGLEAERIRHNFENGAEGYTEEMVKEAKQGYEDAMDEFSTAYADAEGVGEDLTQGMTDGAENKRPDLLAKARSLVSGFLKAVKDESDSHSPSRKAIAIFEDIGEGAAIGVENKTEDVRQAGVRQAAAVLDAYSEQEVHAQRALRGIAEQHVATQAAGQYAAASANGPLLERILTAIEAGQVLLLDGDTLVGGTANRMDRKLGLLRVISARGAKK